MVEQRIAKIIARAGICSRRQAEVLIQAGQVIVNNEIVTNCALKFDDNARIKVQGRNLRAIEPTRLWLYHKSKGLITTHNDPQDRPTVFSNLPKNLPRVISVGRLDFNSEGLLLLTNDGELSRALELPKTNLKRVYRARVFGKFDLKKIEQLKNSIVIDSIKYNIIDIELEKQTGNNSWFKISLAEGKNREVRKIFEYFGLIVNRLIRISYGPFELKDLPINQLLEITSEEINELKLLLKI